MRLVPGGEVSSLYAEAIRGGLAVSSAAPPCGEVGRAQVPAALLAQAEFAVTRVWLGALVL